MEVQKVEIGKLTKNYGFWMVVLLSALIVINLTVFWKMDDVAHVGMSGLYWMAVYSILWDRKKELKFKTQWLPCVIGVILIIWNLYISRSIPASKEINMISVAPFMFSVGVALIASGFYGLKQFFGEILIIFCLGVPRVILNLYTNISPITAKFSSFMLHYLGYPVALDGVLIHLPEGSIRVYEGCSGVESMTYVLGLSVICLIMFPLAKKYNFIVPVVAAAIGFFVNACRVVLLAVLAHQKNEEGFIYWHEGEGSLVFGMIAVIVFASFYWLLMNKTATPPNNNDGDNGKEYLNHSFF